MRCNEDQSTQTIAVTPGAEVEATLASSGVLRFERSGDAMTGAPVMRSEDGALSLQYADGSSVRIKA